HGVACLRGRLVAAVVVEHLPDDGDVGRIATDQLRPDLVVEHMDQRAVAAGAAGSILAFAPTDQAIIGLDAQDRRVERGDLAEITAVLALRLDRNPNPPGLYGLDPHGAPCPRPSGPGRSGGSAT